MLPLALGIACLLALQLIVVGGRCRKRVTLGAFAAGLAVGVVLVGWWLAPPRYLPDAPTSGLAKAFAAGVREGLARPEPVHFVILDGGSYSARGVDGKALEEQLTRDVGDRVVVLSLALAGGNQLERWSVLRNGLALLDSEERERFARSSITLLLEIHAQYDRYPFAQLSRNRYSDRAYAYLDTPVAVEALRAQQAPMEWRKRVQEWLDVAAHAALNLMNVGLATRVLPAREIAPGEGYSPLDRAARKTRFHGTKDVRQSLKRPVDPTIALPMRNISLRKERFARALGTTTLSTIYFSVPSTRVADMDYARGFCERAAAPHRCISHAHWGLMQRLDHRHLWYDGGHMQRPGAEIYTRWFAKRLAPVLAQEARE